MRPDFNRLMIAGKNENYKDKLIETSPNFSPAKNHWDFWDFIGIIVSLTTIALIIYGVFWIIRALAQFFATWLRY